MYYELLVKTKKGLFLPSAVEEITWETKRKGAPGRLEFKVIDSSDMAIEEGNPVRLKVNGQNVFYGFVFGVNDDKSHITKIVAYDQLRYLKNKETYVYTGKTAGEVVEMVAKDFKLQTGTLENTGYKIESRVEDDQTLFDIIQNALDLTLQSTGEIYVLYDDFGKITLKNLGNMKTNVLIDESTGQNFDYKSSIDGETYNKIKLSYENPQTGKREIYIAQDGSHINDWGVLQLSKTIYDRKGGGAKADSLLDLYNRKTKSLTLKGCFGHSDVRAGSLVMVSLKLRDMKVNSLMLVEECKHSFKENEHTMDLKLRGGRINV